MNCLSSSVCGPLCCVTVVRSFSQQRWYNIYFEPWPLNTNGADYDDEVFPSYCFFAFFIYGSQRQQSHLQCFTGFHRVYTLWCGSSPCRVLAPALFMCLVILGSLFCILNQSEDKNKNQLDHDYRLSLSFSLLSQGWVLCNMNHYAKNAWEWRAARE